MTQFNDWRLKGQEKYLSGKIFQRKLYSQRITITDHDHCEFCNQKFTENLPNTLSQGYASEEDYWWVCLVCFQDFQKLLNLKLFKED